MSNKVLYTKIFLKQADKSINNVSVKEHLSLWWQNTRSKEQGGLRLTDEGYRFIKEDLDLQTYDIPYPQNFELTTNTIIWLDNFIDCPYYLGRREIVVTNEKKALELSLFSGNVRKYGLTKALNQQKSS